MLERLSQTNPKPRSLAHAEALSRLASIRHALRLVEPFGSGPASDLSVDETIAAAWDEAGEVRQRRFERRSGRLVGAAAAGVGALLSESQDGRQPNEEAAQALVDEIRRELKDVAGIILA